MWFESVLLIKGVEWRGEWSWYVVVKFHSVLNNDLN